ncbi:hypothetical protein IGI04_026418 [Brassica rapa subsp. trilocularis]|uniref:Uncharacterized protein n=1 Tax=Brassica rapa subsp. trilocularis TaxID=1813537 RepID=A0ABQ7KZW8_BRACM|nr:hypothetical protein IGI04_026418 [Brassica rapa subsp. trilocularis]
MICNVQNLHDFKIEDDAPGFSLPPCSSFSGSRRIVTRSGDQIDDWGLSCAGSGSVPAQRLTGLKRVAASSLPVFSLLCSPLSPASVATLRASPSCSHGPRRSDETEDLVGNLSLSSSDNNHGFLWRSSLSSHGCLFSRSVMPPSAVFEPVVPPMLDRFVGRGPPPAELRGVSQALPLMPARSHFGEFSTELSLAILLFHLVSFRYGKKRFE